MRTIFTALFITTAIGVAQPAFAKANSNSYATSNENSSVSRSNNSSISIGSITMTARPMNTDHSDGADGIVINWSGELEQKYSDFIHLMVSVGIPYCKTWADENISKYRQSIWNFNHRGPIPYDLLETQLHYLEYECTANMAENLNLPVSVSSTKDPIETRSWSTN